MSASIGFLIDLYSAYTKIHFRENAIFHFETTPHCVPPYPNVLMLSAMLIRIISKLEQTLFSASTMLPLRKRVGKSATDALERF